jgi:hypothetical protein
MQCAFRVNILSTVVPVVSKESFVALIFVREHGVHAGPKDYFVVVVVVIRGFV